MSLSIYIVIFLGFETIRCVGITPICSTNINNNIYNRTYCLDYGSYISSDNGAISTTASGFYSYSGVWKEIVHTKINGMETYRWHWQIPSKSCHLIPISSNLFCDIIHEMFSNIKRKRHDLFNHTSPKLTFIGDSITLGHVTALHQQLEPKPNKYIKGERRYDTCGIEIEFVRTNKLAIEKEFNVEVNPFSGTEWIEKICKSDISVINYGSHASSISSFNFTIHKAMKALFVSCGEDIITKKIKVYFRTTAEGNPFCYTKTYDNFKTMDEWNKIVWPVLVDSQKVYDLNLNKKEFFFYNQTWFWNNFQRYNEIARNVLEPYGITIIDIVAMSRLRPTMDWTRPRKPECFHANKAKYEYNVMLMNVFASDLCF